MTSMKQSQESPKVSKETDFQQNVVRVLSQFIAAISHLRLYLNDHPYIFGNIERSFTELSDLFLQNDTFTVFLLEDEVVVNHRPLSKGSQVVEKFVRILQAKGIESLSFLSGLERSEFLEFVRDLASPGTASVSSRPHIRLGKVKIRGQEIEGPLDNLVADETNNEDHDKSLWSRIYDTTDIGDLYSAIEKRRRIDLRHADEIVTRFIREMQQNLSPISLVATIKSSHEYTFFHLGNVCILTMSLAESLGFSGNQLHDIGIAALLHDVGKSFIPDEILSKPGALTPEERSVIETHPVKGGRYLIELGGVSKLAILAALEHHLNFDGTGYPATKPDWKPNVVAQMITVSDVFDALRSRRSYSEPRPLEVAADILRKGKGTHFNPHLVDKFLELVMPQNPIQK
jgi:HD-GYP domain-containing protein (c-di-GMP phosphodiesterase class II)